MPVKARLDDAFEFFNFVGIRAGMVQHGEAPVLQVVQPSLRREEAVLAVFRPQRPVSSAAKKLQNCRPGGVLEGINLQSWNVLVVYYLCLHAFVLSLKYKNQDLHSERF